LEYIFPAGGLLRSSPNMVVKIKLRKVKLKTRDFCSFIRSTLQGFFRLSDSFLLEEAFLIQVNFSSRLIQLKYIFSCWQSAGIFLEYVCKIKLRKANQKPAIFADLEGALCRASLD
jgi:hypothetical protein